MARTDIEVDAVFDIETEDWDKFVAGGILFANGDYKQFTWKQENDYIDTLLSIRGSVWAHNGGRFDTLHLLDALTSRKNPPKTKLIATGSRVVLAEVGETKICDSCALVPLSLEKAAGIADIPKTSTGLACDCGRECGGYCRIRRSMDASEMGALLGYLEQDCKATLAYLQKIREYAAENDLDLRLTIGSSAWTNLQRLTKAEPASWKNAEHLYHRARAGYYGGRVQVFCPESQDGTRADINSAYPAALRTIKVPSGNRFDAKTPKKTEIQWYFDRPGIYEATVFIPRDLFMPPLPTRLLDGRIAYPVGKVRGSWTALELKNALSIGCKLIQFHSCVVWDSLISLRPWVDKIWNLRFEAGKSTPMGKWLKLYANSATGKFAQKPDKSQMRVGEPENPIGWRCAFPNRDIWQKDVSFHSPNAHVQWSAYLTAAARLTLFRQLHHAGREAVYCDTDSCYAARPRHDFLNVGSELGQWDIEGGYRDFQAIAPKFYRYVDPATGVKCVRSKGLPSLDFDQFEAFKNGETLTQDRGVMQLKSALNAGGSLFRRKKITRSNKQDGIRFGDRVLSLDGRTYPADIRWLQLWTTTKGRKEPPKLKEPHAYAEK
jgi:hypothetical protein